ncbi:chorismate mutase [Roseibium sp. Sym1]|uniref:chorismate mutase n=1 Tax=Roseibium sp. Sym1 TaxID=3016006 RepID=UPI0022B573DA|nr:chorismate mutase [Roseibium sp. Sym1]
MSIPPELTEIRENIDRLDDRIVPLLVERIDLALRASDYKNTVQEVKGADRVRAVLDKVARRAENAGGHEDVVRKIYSAVITELTELQLRKKGI